ncbi:MAG: amino acid adenylation domain-containing protein, partial [Zoogloeaceae bacterium]|nr:amino acid adenylation domain-containing protein [Zoogloeaceae bacterium]
MELCCCAAIIRNAERFADKTALVHEGASLSYAALLARSRALAQTLRAGGVRAGQIVPVALPRGIEAVVALLGIWQAGGAPCFLNEDYPPERLALLRAQCHSDWVLDADWLARQTIPPHGGADVAPYLPAPDDPGLVVFTSGSTGLPKGVLLPHRTLALAAQGDAALFVEDDVHLATASFSFVALLPDVVAPLVAGATLHIAGEPLRRDVAGLARYVEAHAITTAVLQPQLARPFLAIADGRLRRILTGSERVERLWSAKTSIVNLYGASETGGPVVGFIIDQPYDNTPVGRAWPGSQVVILDATGEPVAPGQTGEICVRGQIASGYLNDPELTAARFVTGPDGARCFRSGDLGCWLADGTLQYVERQDWMLKVRGFRVEPGDIEAAMRKVAPLDQAVVTGFANAEGQTRLYACYTAKQPIDAERVRQALVAILPAYMLPSFIEQVAALPVNAHGKVDRRRIAPPALERYQGDYVAPRSATEIALCDAFAHLLGVPRVGLDDDFVRLGGDSIAAVRLQTRLPEPGLSAAQILAERTPRRLARLLEASGSPAATIPPAAERREWPLSFAERQMVTEQALKPDSVEYNLNLALALSGPFDLGKLKAALEALLARHRVLRSRYLARPEGWVRVLDDTPIALWQRACPPEAVADAIEAANLPYDLAAAPLCRFTLYQTGPERAVLHLGFHHALIDGLGIDIVLSDLWALYQGQTLPALAPDYLDYAVWQGRQAEDAAGMAFFAQQFADGLPENEMPIRGLRPAQLPVPDAEAARRLSFRPLDHVAARLGTTPYTALVAALGLTLAKYGNSDDVVLGMTVNGRVPVATGNMVGMFVNLLPLRLQMADDLSLHAFVRQTGERLQALQAHQDLPFSRVVERFAPGRDASRYPLFDLMVNYRQAPALPAVAGLTIEQWPTRPQAIAVDLAVEMIHEGETLAVRFAWSRQLYDDAIIEGMLDHFCAVIARLTAGEDLALPAAAELGDAQRRQILEDFAGEKRPAAPGSVIDAFRAQVARTPDKTALVFRDETLTYAELAALTDRLAGQLAEHGAGPGQVVGSLVSRSLLLAVLPLAILKTGAAFLPLDPGYPAERLTYMLADSGATLVLAQAALATHLAGFAGTILTTEDLLAAPGAPAAPAPASAPDDLFVLFYTSGTTGKPKGVMVTHGNVRNVFAWKIRHYGMHPADVVSAYFSCGFDPSLGEIFPALLSGATLHVIDEALRLDLPGLNAYWRACGVTIAGLPMQMGRQFIETQQNDTLRHLYLGGERLSLAALPEGYTVHNEYGPTECTILVTATPVTRPGPVPLGRAIDNTRLLVLDRHGRLAPVGVAGELCVAGPQVSRGYLNRPDATAEKFIPNPFSADPACARLYRTGDLARFLPDGQLDFVGRQDFQVKIRGFRVELGEIEGRLRAFPGIAAATVVATEAPGGGQCVVAYLVPTDPAARLDLDAVKRFVGEALPPYMIPAAILPIGRIPLTPNGKVDRKALPAPQLEWASHSQTWVPPANPTEVRLCDAFAQLLGVPRVGAEDDFLLLGGSSISAVRLQTQVADLGLSALDILALKTPRALAGKAAESQQRQPVAVAAPRDVWPLTDGERQILTEQQLAPESVAYNVCLAFSLRGALDVARLERALAALIARHRILRAYFPLQNGEFVCRLAALAPVVLQRQRCQPDAVDAAIAALNLPFDPGQPPLYRFVLFEVGEAHWVFHVNVHHTLVDGMSGSLLLADLARLYAEDGQGGAAPLSPDYLDYAVWQAGQDHRADDEAFFRTLFEKGKPDTEMPIRARRPEVLPLAETTATARFSWALLRQSAERQGVTPYTLILSATALLLAKYCGSPAISLGVVTNGRAHPDTVGMVGMFVNTLPLRFEVAGGQKLADFVRQTGEILAGALAHQACPFARLVEALAPERDAARGPLFDLLLNYLEDLPVPAMPGLDVAALPAQLHVQSVDLALNVVREGDTLTLMLSYSPQLYDAAVIDDMMALFTGLLERLAQGADLPLAGAMALPERQQRQLLDDFAGKVCPAPAGPNGQPLTVVDAFLASVARHPEAEALIAGERRFTWQALDTLSNQLACVLIACGQGRGGCVGVLVRRDEMLVVAPLAVLKTGAAYLPLDASYPAERLEFMLADAGVTCLIADPELRDRVPGFGGEIVSSGATADWRGLPPDGPSAALPRPEDWLVVLYTSGTTGKPKGVMLSHANLANFCDWYIRRYRLGEADTVPAYASCGFDAALMDIFPALGAGARIVVVPEALRLDLPGLNALFEQEKVTVAFLTTQLGRQFVLSQPGRSLRALSVGGEALTPLAPPETYALHNLYGPTECTICITASEVDRPDRVSLGRPLDNTRLYILDAEGQLAPVGVAGELCVAGRSVAMGYLNRPELSAEKFVPNPFSTEADYARIYRTGD